MTTTSKVLIGLGIAGALVSTYFIFFHWTRGKAEKIILNGFTSTKNLSFGQDDYLIAWAKAAKKGDEFFVLDGKKYYTRGGKATKPSEAELKEMARIKAIQQTIGNALDADAKYGV